MDATHANDLAGNQNAPPACWMTDIFWVVLVDGENSGGGYSVVEQWMRGGTSLPLHAHAATDEWFNVIEGEMEVQMLDERITVKAGESVWIPRRTLHGFKVTSRVCKVLNGYTPGGIRQLVHGTPERTNGVGCRPARLRGAEIPALPIIPRRRR